MVQTEKVRTSVPRRHLLHSAGPFSETPQHYAWAVLYQAIQDLPSLLASLHASAAVIQDGCRSLAGSSPCS